MKLKILMIITMFFLIPGCTGKKESGKAINESITINNIAIKPAEGYTLLKNNCYACHSVITKSHDEIIAPPLVAIKRRYKVAYDTKEDFVDAVTNWVLDPKEEKALMRGAVNQFKVMPKQAFNKEDIIKIATYIFDNELERPVWFEQHFSEEHPNGMGNGQGRGKGRRFRGGSE